MSELEDNFNLSDAEKIRQQAVIIEWLTQERKETIALINATIAKVEDAETLNEELQQQVRDLREALGGIIEIGKRDMTNPKYDSYFEKAHAALASSAAPITEKEGGK